MDFQRLRYFLVVSETSNLRRAADLLRISPPALSKAMKLLQEEIGERLFIEEGRGILITEYGRRLADRARPLVDSFDRLSVPESPESPPVRLGTFEVFSTYFLSEILESLQGLPISLHELVPGQIERALQDRQIDLGITYLPIPTAGVDHVRVGKVEMDVYGVKGAPSNLPFVIPITPISGTPTKVQGLDGWPDNELKRDVRYHVTLMESALELCRRGLAVSYLPSFVVRLHNEVTQDKFHLKATGRKPLPKERTQEVYLVKRKSDLEDLTAKRVARALRTVLGK